MWVDILAKLSVALIAVCSPASNLLALVVTWDSSLDGLDMNFQ